MCFSLKAVKVFVCFHNRQLRLVLQSKSKLKEPPKNVLSVFVFADKILKAAIQIVWVFMNFVIQSSWISLSYIGIQIIFKPGWGERTSASQGCSDCSWSVLMSLHCPVLVWCLVFRSACVWERQKDRLYLCTSMHQHISEKKKQKTFLLVATVLSIEILAPSLEFIKNILAKNKIKYWIQVVHLESFNSFTQPNGVQNIIQVCKWTQITYGENRLNVFGSIDHEIKTKAKTVDFVLCVF